MIFAVAIFNTFIGETLTVEKDSRVFRKNWSSWRCFFREQTFRSNIDVLSFFYWLMLSWVPMSDDALVDIWTIYFFEAGLTLVVLSSNIWRNNKVSFALIAIWSTRLYCKLSCLTHENQPGCQLVGQFFYKTPKASICGFYIEYSFHVTSFQFQRLVSANLSWLNFGWPFTFWNP